MVNKGCTCYMRDVSRKGHIRRKRAQRYAEKRDDRATLVVEQQLRSLLIRG